MAKLKNLFLGCQVALKSEPETVGTVTDIDEGDGSVFVWFRDASSSFDTWYSPSELILVPHPEPYKVYKHLDRFLKVGDKFELVEEIDFLVLDKGALVTLINLDPTDRYHQYETSSHDRYHIPSWALKPI